MSCFYYDKQSDAYIPHKPEYKPCIEADNTEAPINLMHPFSLLIAVQAEKLFSDCLW